MVQRMHTPALSKQWVLDAQWTDLPEEIEQVIVELWRIYDLGNDHCIIRNSVGDFWEQKDMDVEVWDEKEGKWVTKLFDPTPLVEYLLNQGLKEDDTVIIHWWW